MFGETVSFTFENGSKKYTSIPGAILSLFVLFAVAVQFLEKYEVLVN